MHCSIDFEAHSELITVAISYYYLQLQLAESTILTITTPGGLEHGTVLQFVE